MARNTKSKSARIEQLESRRLFSAIYVAMGGSDAAPGSVDAPVASLQHALDIASPGDAVLLRGGMYAGNVTVRTPNLTITSAPGEVAAIMAPVDDPAVEVNIRIGEDANGTQIRSLDISGGSVYAIKTESTWDTGASNPHGPDGVVISGNRIHDTGRDVIKLTPATNHTLIEYNEIWNSGRADASNAEGIDAVQANYATVRGNNIHDIATNGIYFKGGSVGTLIERNIVYNIGNSGILLGQSTDENCFDTSVDPQYYESLNSTVRNNIVYHVEGAGIGAWAALNPMIYNNTLVDVARSMFAGLLVQGQEHWIPDDHIVPSTNVMMFNNIVKVRSDRPVLEIRDQGLSGGLYLSNNLYCQHGRPAQISDATRGYQGDLAGWQGMGFDAFSKDASPSLDRANGFAPMAGSPAIMGGRPAWLAEDIFGNARPAGSVMDIGARQVS